MHKTETASRLNRLSQFVQGLPDAARIIGVNPTSANHYGMPAVQLSGENFVTIYADREVTLNGGKHRDEDELSFTEDGVVVFALLPRKAKKPSVKTIRTSEYATPLAASNGNGKSEAAAQATAPAKEKTPAASAEKQPAAPVAAK